MKSFKILQNEKLALVGDYNEIVTTLNRLFENFYLEQNEVFEKNLRFQQINALQYTDEQIGWVHLHNSKNFLRNPRIKPTAEMILYLEQLCELMGSN